MNQFFIQLLLVELIMFIMQREWFLNVLSNQTVGSLYQLPIFDTTFSVCIIFYYEETILSWGKVCQKRYPTVQPQ